MHQLRYGVLLLLALFVAGIAYADKPDKKKPSDDVDLVKDFTLVDVEGKEHKLSSYKDKIVVLEWTEPFCPYVIRHYKAKTMQNLASKYGEKGVVWLAVCSSATTTEQLKEFSKKWSAIIAKADRRNQKEVQESIDSEVFSHARVRALASNPLISTILILLPSFFCSSGSDRSNDWHSWGLHSASRSGSCSSRIRRAHPTGAPSWR